MDLDTWSPACLPTAVSIIIITIIFIIVVILITIITIIFISVIIIFITLPFTRALTSLAKMDGFMVRNTFVVVQVRFRTKFL